jgi:P4 family phage/plasmid primase-like protien
VAPPSLHPDGVPYQAIGVDRIHKPDDLAGFIDKRLAELGLKARGTREAPRERAKPSTRGRPERTDEFNELAIEKLLQNCTFIQYCRDNATTLSEPWWWSMISVLVRLGEPGKKKIHELSQPYPGYTERETEQKIKEALKASEKDIGPHTCTFIEQDLGFACPETCQAKSLGVKSPAGLASILAARDLRGPYFYYDKNGNLKLDMEVLTKDILNEFKFITLSDTEEVLVYDSGFWQYGGEEKIKAEAENRVGLSKLLTVHIINEIIGHIQRSTYVARALLNQDPRIGNLKNGLLDIRTRELKPHTPEFLSTIRTPVAYDPNADCPRIKRFFAEVLELQDIPVIHELFGYALIPDYSIQRAFLFIGDGSNGKSTLLSLLRTFLGKDNCSSVPWHALEYSRFASSRLDGKLLNIYADLPSRSMDSTGVFKMLTGGDAISAEKKFKDGYSFVNFARLVFSANKPPRILDEDSYAFWRRWIIINFPNQFPENDPKTDPEILSKLTTEAELSGLLNLALDGLQRVLSNAKFSYGKTVDQTQSYYLRASDPVYAFVEDCCEIDSDTVTSKDALFEAFKNYCKESKTPLINRDSFAKTLKNSPHFKVTLTRPRVGDERVPSWRGIKVVSPVSPVSPLGVTLRDAREEKNNGINKGVSKVNKSIEKRADTSDRADQKPYDIPDYPTTPCPTCGCPDYWLSDDNRWLCARCHPKPREIDMEV